MRHLIVFLHFIFPGFPQIVPDVRKEKEIRLFEAKTTTNAGRKPIKFTTAVICQRGGFSLLFFHLLIQLLAVNCVTGTGQTNEQSSLQSSKLFVETIFNDLLSEKRLYHEDYSSIGEPGDTWIIQDTKYYTLLPDKDVKLLTNGKNLRFTLSWNYLDILNKKQQELTELKELPAITKQDSQNIETMIKDIDLIRTILTNLPNDTSIEVETDIVCDIDFKQVFNALEEYDHLLPEVTETDPTTPPEQKTPITNKRKIRQSDNDDSQTDTYSDYIETLLNDNSFLFTEKISVRKNDISSLTETTEDWTRLFESVQAMSPENENEDNIYHNSLCKIMFNLPSVTDIVTLYENQRVLDETNGHIIHLTDLQDSLNIERQFLLDFGSIHLTDIEVDYLLLTRRQIVTNPQQFLDYNEGKQQLEKYDTLTSEEKLQFDKKHVDKLQKIIYYKKVCSTQWGGNLNKYTCPRIIHYNTYLPDCLKGVGVFIFSGIDDKRILEQNTDPKLLLQAQSDPVLYKTIFSSLETNTEPRPDNNEVDPDSNINVQAPDSIQEHSANENSLEVDSTTNSDKSVTENYWWDNTYALLNGQYSANLHHRKTRNGDSNSCKSELESQTELLSKKCLRELFQFVAENDRSHGLAIFGSKITSILNHLLASESEIKGLKTAGNSEMFEKICANFPNVKHIDYTKTEPIMYTTDIVAALMRSVRFCSFQYCHMLDYKKPYLVTMDSRHCYHGHLISKDIYICLENLSATHHPCYGAVDGFQNCEFVQFARDSNTLKLQMVNSGSGFIQTENNLLRVNTYPDRREIGMVVLNSQVSFAIQLKDNSPFFLSKNRIRKFFDNPDTAVEAIKNILYGLKNYTLYFWTLIAIFGATSLFCGIFALIKIKNACKRCMNYYNSVPQSDPSHRTIRTVPKVVNKKAQPKTVELRGTATSPV